MPWYSEGGGNLRLYNLDMFLYDLLTSHSLLENRSHGIHCSHLFYHHSKYVNYMQ